MAASAEPAAGGLGTLYLVPTPIGNFTDISSRATDVLRAAAVVAAEDTRKARTLLRALGISARLISYHDFNEESRSAELLRLLQAGQDVALISDAGTPLLNDPGYRIVCAAIAHGARVSPLPGPSAVVTALVGSGLPAHRFLYAGFLPRKSAARQSAVRQLADLPATLIFFEAPHRLQATVSDLREVLGDREAALARNLTKKDEEYIRGSLSAIGAELASRAEIRGEYTVLVAAAPEPDLQEADQLADRIARSLLERGIEPHVARDVVKDVTSLPRNRVYECVRAAQQGSTVASNLSPAKTSLIGFNFMTDSTLNSTRSGPRAARDVADSYVVALTALDPLLATQLGLRPDEDRLPDFSPAGQEALDELARSTLAELDAVQTTYGEDDRRCARLLRERLESGLAVSGQGEHLRAISNLFGPVQRVRNVFLDMPTATEDDWAVIARRMARVGQALAGYRGALDEGLGRGLLAAPRQVRTVAGQLAEWTAVAAGKGWFAEFAAGASVSPALRADLDHAASSAIASVADLGQWLAGVYLPRAQGLPDGVGAERYRVLARRWTGADLEPEDAYAWGWSEFQTLRVEMAQEAQRVLPGASPLAAMQHLDSCGESVEGVEQIRLRLQQMMDDAIRDLDGTHFDIADRVKVVQARIAPPGSAAAPYYTAPSQDFTRPGRTWLPTLGRTRFPLWNLISVWYHEGVPGHHLQLAQWRHLSGQLSMYQTSVGGVSACSEGWALYAERLMDELGYLSSPGARLGYLEAQLMRAIRVVIDIGMHLELQVPDDSPLGAGQRWTPDLAREFFGAHSGRDAAFLDSEIVRYLSMPGQAISYKLGERAWLTGRDAARAARGGAFDLKSWHMAALSLGSLGLDDLTDELASL